MTGVASEMLYSIRSVVEDTRAGAVECERKKVEGLEGLRMEMWP